MYVCMYVKAYVYDYICKCRNVHAVAVFPDPLLPVPPFASTAPLDQGDVRVVPAPSASVLSR